MFECVALLPDFSRVRVEAIQLERGVRLLHVFPGRGPRRDLLPRLTDHARRMVREQVETAIAADYGLCRAREC